METDRTESLLDLVDHIRKKANIVNWAHPSTSKKRLDLEGLAASAFSEGFLHKALDWLTRAINLLPSAPLYAKRSVVHLHLENNILAAADATCAIGTDPDFASGYLCAALSRIRLAEYEEGLKYLEKLRRCYPNSKKINSIYVSCRNMYWETGKIKPFHPPTSISNDFISEEYSALDEDKLTDLKVDLSSSGVLEASKLTEDFVRRVIETYKRGVFHLPQKYMTMILRNVLDVLKESPNIVSIDISRKQALTVVGDLRGQFNNLLSIFRLNRSPHFGRPYLFNGNVIGADRMSLPTLIIVLSLKILFPEDVFINRGSEDCLEMCEINGFETEVLTIYDEDTMKGFTEVFNWLPLAHVLNNNVLIIHGGLFEDENVTLADLQNMKRFYQPPDAGPMCDLLHSDPWNYKGISRKGRVRGIWFGPDVTERFCLHNCIDFIVRSHQNVGEFGYEVQTYRQCLTVDSSTDYATFLVIRGKTSSFKWVHARKEKLLPNNCKCFLVCNCNSPEEPKQADPLHDGYVSTNLALPDVPSILEVDEDQCVSNGSLAIQSTPSLPQTDLWSYSKPILVTGKNQTSIKTGDLRVSFSHTSMVSKSAQELAASRSDHGVASLSASVIVMSSDPLASPKTPSKTSSNKSGKSKSEELSSIMDQQTLLNMSPPTPGSAGSLVKMGSQISAGKKSPNIDMDVPSFKPEEVDKVLFVSSEIAGSTSQKNLAILADNPHAIIPLAADATDGTKLANLETAPPNNKYQIQQKTTDDDTPSVEPLSLLIKPNPRTEKSYSALKASSSINSNR